MSIRKRPLSPHLQVYKPQISSITSIMHRITGVALYFSLIAICWYIVYYAYQVNVGDDSPACDCAMFKIAFYTIVSCITFALYYHFCNGIRHLFWDVGKGFDKETANRNGIIVILLSLIFTVTTIILVFFFHLT